MARSILENPNFSWATWNPTAWTDPVEDTTTEDVATTSGLAPILYPPVTGEGNQNQDITQLTNTIPQQRMLTPEEKALFGGYEMPDRGLLVAPGDALNQGYNYLDDEDYIDRIMDENLMRLYPQQYKQRKERGSGIRSVISTAWQGAKDFVQNLGQRKQELRDQGYSEDEIEFIGANAMGQQFVDAGKYDPTATYYNTPSGVKDEFGYNVYARNYMNPGSASYNKWSGITGSLAYKDRTTKEKTQKEKQAMQLVIAEAEKKEAEGE